MTEIEDLLRDIEILREKLLHLINEKQGNLSDEEIISASRILDAVLNEYDKVFKKILRN